MAETNIILFGCREDGTVPMIKALTDGETQNAYQAAQAFLAEHDSCSSVELWAEDNLLATVRRAN